MKRNMKQWIDELRDAEVKKAMPILSFPSISLMDTTVRDLISSGEMQARGMKLVADRVNSAASVSMMDLSVEAEAFGSTIKVSDDEVPTVTGHIIETEEQADALQIPTVQGNRTGRYVDAIAKACELITDRPVFAGVIGPFSLAGRLLDVSEIMVLCYDEPDMVHTVLEKVSTFIIDYMRAYRAAGANGVMVAEPLAGLLSPALMKEFAAPYMKKIIDAVQDDEFIVIYHNCGNAVMRLVDDIVSCGASAYHFGNAIDIGEMLERMPDNVPVMGNIDPVSQFTAGTPESIYAETTALLERCSVHRNFIISSGCDIPPLAKWENIDAFFRAVEDFYRGK
ncbi:MAG: uroporphyrinogen decarboxylase family protein [Clostridia bacterium]|nr:uroporphyrinogen decarboxylase family protein [Clostridia bacterium]